MSHPVARLLGWVDMPLKMVHNFGSGVVMDWTLVLDTLLKPGRQTGCSRAVANSHAAMDAERYHGKTTWIRAERRCPARQTRGLPTQHGTMRARTTHEGSFRRYTPILATFKTPMAAISVMGTQNRQSTIRKLNPLKDIILVPDAADGASFLALGPRQLRSWRRRPVQVWTAQNVGRWLDTRCPGRPD